MGGLIQHISNPFIEAFTAGLGCRGDSGVNAGWNAQGQLAGVWFVRLISKLGAGGKIMVNRLFEGCFRFFHGLAVEGNNISNARQAAKENTILGVKLNAGGIAFVSHGVLHGVTPISLRKSRAALTRYRKASLPGCGRWKAAFRPLCKMVILEPLPSMISQPAALNRASILRHSILPETGSAKTASKVFRWLRFIDNMISLFATMSRRF